ncbi:MAG: N-(5'-phosphoribosyl)anthranilate isomerase, partial [Bacteroidia bacterium]|nr:N-(5'-phosphoribosyl)anthranilate isomerase [Bacteroidia bacterium]
MALKVKVKVGNITNLSDARYCAGMGVDMLGFATIKGAAFHITADLYQQLRGWISGPSYVAQVAGLQNAGALAEIVEQFQPDYLEVDLPTLEIIGNATSLPLIVKVARSDESIREQLDSLRQQIA